MFDINTIAAARDVATAEKKKKIKTGRSVRCSNAQNRRNAAAPLPGRMELALVLRVRVTVDGDDANRRAGRVRDDDWLGERGAGAGRSHAAAADVRRRGDAPGNINKTH